MKGAKILIIGGGIGGLTSAIALGKKGFKVEVVERDPNWAVYGVGIIQQSNVVRAVAALGILDDYLEAGFGFDYVDVRLPDGSQAMRIPSPKLADGYPANVGIARPALHRVLGTRAVAAGARIRLGMTADRLEDTGKAVTAYFSDGKADDYDLVIGADGLYSSVRKALFPKAAPPQFTGQGVWRYNFEKPDDLDCLRAYLGPVSVGLVPLSKSLMYMYVTTAEPGNPFYAKAGLAAVMRQKLQGAPPAAAALATQITKDEGVVYRPLEWQFLTGEWHKGRIVLLGDAVHATTPHLGQGAGMAIEDSLVLAEELERASKPEEAFKAFRNRRFERCKYIVERSKAIGDSQIGKGPHVDQGAATAEMFEIVSAAI